MWSVAVLFGFVVCVTCTIVRNDCVYPEKYGYEPDYYWRNYFGVIPKDAISGGYDETGNITYIGQLGSAKHPGTFPGNLYPGKKAAVGVFGGKVIDDTYVKVLCSNPANKFEWISTTADDCHLLTDYHWVIGGAQTKASYIGRANLDGQVQVGRVFDSPSSVNGLWVYNKTGSEINLKSFELLVIAR